MFKQLIELTAQIFFLAKDTQQNKAQESKYMAPQLENDLLKFERRLPSHKPEADEREK